MTRTPEFLTLTPPIFFTIYAQMREGGEEQALLLKSCVLVGEGGNLRELEGPGTKRLRKPGLSCTYKNFFHCSVEVFLIFDEQLHLEHGLGDNTIF